jgi:hypothetical protein
VRRAVFVAAVSVLIFGAVYFLVKVMYAQAEADCAARGAVAEFTSNYHYICVAPDGRIIG